MSTPPSSSSSSSSSSSHTTAKSISLPPPVDDGSTFTPPDGLPDSALATMSLAIHHPQLIATMDLAPTWMMMERGQVFTQYVVNAEKKKILLFFNKSEVRRDGTISMCSTGGTLYWTDPNSPNYSLSFHRSIPLRNINELTIGKMTAGLQAESARQADDDLCFTIMSENAQLELECSSKVQICSWLLGLTTLMMTMTHKTARPVQEDRISSDQRYSRDKRNINQRADDTVMETAVVSSSSSNNRRATARYSMVCVPSGQISNHLRSASKDWWDTMQYLAPTIGSTNTTLGGADTDTDRPRGRDTAAAAIDPLQVMKQHLNRCIIQPFHQMKKAYLSMNNDVNHCLQSLSHEFFSQCQHLLQLTQQQQQHLFSLQVNHTTLHTQHSALQSLHQRVQLEYTEEQRKRKVLQNKVIDLQGNIRVYCRVRPSSEQEKRDGDENVMECMGENMLVVQNPINNSTNNGSNGITSNGSSSSASGGSKSFEFDRVFDGQSTQEQVFKDVAPFVQSCVDGYNVCVFAYGQTGSGKSYTMEGPAGDPGVNYRALTDLFNLTKIEQHKSSPYSPYYQAADNHQQDTLMHTTSATAMNADNTTTTSPTSSPPPDHFFYSITVSVLELYNETLCDLLVNHKDKSKRATCASPSPTNANGNSNNNINSNGGSSDGKGLEIKQGADGVYVPDLTTVRVSSVEEVIHLLQTQAYPQRHTAATQMNDHSSRSHCLLFIRVHGLNHVTEEQSYGQLVLIDLAGSERVTRSGATGIGMKEAQCINQSLSALGNCINALQSKATHIPYRNSKLTYLLSDCLGGNSKCLMFCQLSPSASSYGESLCSLHFASRARAVELGMAKKNSGVTGEEVKRLKSLMEKDKKEKERMKEELTRMSKMIKEHNASMTEKLEVIRSLQGNVREREKEISVIKEKQQTCIEAAVNSAVEEAELQWKKKAEKSKKKVDFAAEPPVVQSYSYDYQQQQQQQQQQQAATAAAQIQAEQPAQQQQENASVSVITSPSSQSAFPTTPLRSSSLYNKKRKDSPMAASDHGVRKKMTEENSNNNNNGQQENKGFSSTLTTANPAAFTIQAKPLLRERREKRNGIYSHATTTVTPTFSNTTNTSNINTAIAMNAPAERKAMLIHAARKTRPATTSALTATTTLSDASSTLTPVCPSPSAARSASAEEAASAVSTVSTVSTAESKFEAARRRMMDRKQRALRTNRLTPGTPTASNHLQIPVSTAPPIAGKWQF